MRYLFLLILAVAATFRAHAQLFDYDDVRAGKFAVKTVSGVRPMADGEYYTAVGEGRIVRYAYKTGAEAGVVFDRADFKESISDFSDYAFSADETKILLTTNRKPVYRRSFTADYWVYDRAAKTLRRLTDGGAEQVAAFSPDGSRVAFVRDNDIWVVRLADYSLSRVTSDGERNRIINGHTDWVYEEEFAFTRAFEWSPDGRRIAYLRFDESRVPEYTMMRFGQNLYPQPYTYKYPKAGEPNSSVELYVYDLSAGTASKVDTGTEADQYLPRIGWTPAGELFFYRTNRRQNHFELLLSDATGRSRVVYDEKDSRYVERVDGQTVTFLPRGDRFVVKNETSGNMHLYLFDVDKGVVDTLTRGNWDVTALVGISDGRAYYISNEGSPLRTNLYTVKMNGSGKKRLTQEDGTFSVAPGRGFKYFISYFSNVSTPNLVRLHDASGKVLRTLEDNAALKKMIDERRVSRKEFFRFRNDFGNLLNGYMIKPYNFDPSRKYPVLMTQYSGPGSQEVLDKWSMDWTDVLVQDGYIVVCVDGRGTGGRGAEFKKSTYGNLGAKETEDQIAAAKYVSTLPYVDPARIGIYGWSYGGFMALNCILKGADIFKMAIAVAPVTSWRFYDTIYTEIYNGLPQDNAKGYDDNSPVNFADRLKGRLLIVHGSGDDNVHVQNTYRMADALVRAGKPFDMAIYPDDNHSMVPAGRHHIRQRMIDYVHENL